MAVACNSSGTNRLLQRLGPSRDPQALSELFARHQERLRKMVRLRLDSRLRGRISSTAILQEVQREAGRRVADYLAEAPPSFFLWLRMLAGRRLQQVHQENFGQDSVEAGQELSLYRGALPEVNALSMAAQLMGERPGHQAAVRADLLLRLQEALNSMEPFDREIVALRNFEELSMVEASLVLGVDKPAATLRYVQALKRFNEIIRGIPGLRN